MDSQTDATVYLDPQNIAYAEEMNAKLTAVDSYLSRFISTCKMSKANLYITIYLIFKFILFLKIYLPNTRTTQG